MHHEHRIRLSLAAVFLAGLAGAAAGPQSPSGDWTPNIAITSLGRIPVSAAGVIPLVSGDNRHAAYPVLRGGQWTVSLDGTEGRAYRKVSGLLFSPDGRRLAFVAEKAPEREVVVVDGQEGPEHGSIDADSLKFSPDSLHLAYAAGPTNSLKVCVVLDGRVGAQFDIMCGASPGRPLLFFSPDSRRLAYAAGNKTADHSPAYSVILEGPDRSSSPTANTPTVQAFNPKNERLAWIEDTGSRRRLLIGGKVSKEFDEFGRDSFRFSPDGTRMAYFAKFENGWKAVVDDAAGPAYDSLGDTPPTFSPDGRRLAYVAVRGEDSFVVVDGREGPHYDGIGRNSLGFSPDGAHFAYEAQRGTKHVAVRDGQESPPYDALHPVMCFSPDGRHMAFGAERDGRWSVVLDGKEGKDFDALADHWLCFSPDSKHLAYGGVRDGETILVVDEQQIATYEAGLGTLAFSATDTLNGMAVRLDEAFHPEIVRFEIRLADSRLGR